MFDDLTFARFTFTIRAETRMPLPAYKGGTLRGGFGYTLKRIVCAYRNTHCSDCILSRQCVYGYIFDTSPPLDSDILEKFTDVPRPFIIEPPLDGKKDYNPGDEMSFGLVLIGRAIELLPYFILSFENLGERGFGKERGRFSLQKVESGTEEVYRGESHTIMGEPRVMRASDLTPDPDMDVERVTLKFLTPVRMKHTGRLTDSPEFHILISTLFRRATSLAYFHCGISSDADPKDVLSTAMGVNLEKDDTRWYDWRRYSSRWERVMTLGGLLGRATYTGHLENFIPLLLLGEYIHVGKCTSFGLGKYSFAPVDLHTERRRHGQPESFFDELWHMDSGAAVESASRSGR